MTPATKLSQVATFWLVRLKANKDLYWNHKLGWVGILSAEVFLIKQPDKLPPGGEWLALVLAN